MLYQKIYTDGKETCKNCHSICFQGIKIKQQNTISFYIKIITIYNTDNNNYVEMITKCFSYLEDRLELSYKTLNTLSSSKLAF